VVTDHVMNSVIGCASCAFRFTAFISRGSFAKVLSQFRQVVGSLYHFNMTSLGGGPKHCTHIHILMRIISQRLLKYEKY
jgi:hypothetical protein